MRTTTISLLLALGITAVTAGVTTYKGQEGTKDMGTQKVVALPGDSIDFCMIGSGYYDLNPNQHTHFIKGITPDRKKTISFIGYSNEAHTRIHLARFQYTSPDTSINHEFIGEPRNDQEKSWQAQYEKLVQVYQNRLTK